MILFSENAYFLYNLGRKEEKEDGAGGLGGFMERFYFGLGPLEPHIIMYKSRREANFMHFYGSRDPSLAINLF